MSGLLQHKNRNETASTKTSDAIRIMLVDDHRVVRAGLRMLLDQWRELTITAEADTREDALAAAAATQPDIILLDLDLNGCTSLDFLGELLQSAAQAKVIMLTGVRDAEQHRRAIRLGARGVVMKDQATEMLIKAIEKVHAGEVWLDRMMMAAVLDELARPAAAEQVNPEEGKIESLTEREHAVIALVCQGYQNKAIGYRLSIREPTVRHHLTSIFTKLELASRLELVIYAYRHGLYSPEVERAS